MNPIRFGLSLAAAAVLQGSLALAQDSTWKPQPTSLSGHAFYSSGPGSGFGGGGELEHVIGRRGRFSVALPVFFQFSDRRTESENRVAMAHHYRLPQAAPTVRFHPFDAYYPTGISIGVRAACGLLDTRQELQNSVFGGWSRPRSPKSFFFAPGLDLGLNFRRPKGTIYSLYAAAGPILGGDLGTGFDNEPIARKLYLQLGFRFGGVL